MKVRLETACCFIIIVLVILAELVVGNGAYSKASEISSSYEQAMQQQLADIFDEEIPLSDEPIY